MHSLITKYGEWVYRAVLLAAMFISLWLSSRYVSRPDFELLATRVATMDITLKLMEEHNRVNDRQDETLRDHESRMRAIERIVHP